MTPMRGINPGRSSALLLPRRCALLLSTSPEETYDFDEVVSSKTNLGCFEGIELKIIAMPLCDYMRNL